MLSLIYNEIQYYRIFYGHQESTSSRRPLSVAYFSVVTNKDEEEWVLGEESQKFQLYTFCDKTMATNSGWVCKAEE